MKKKLSQLLGIVVVLMTLSNTSYAGTCQGHPDCEGLGSDDDFIALG
jgi:hypothetical protein